MLMSTSTGWHHSVVRWTSLKRDLLMLGLAYKLVRQSVNSCLCTRFASSQPGLSQTVPEYQQILEGYWNSFCYRRIMRLCLMHEAKIFRLWFHEPSTLSCWTVSWGQRTKATAVFVTIITEQKEAETVNLMTMLVVRVSHETHETALLRWRTLGIISFF